MLVAGIILVLFTWGFLSSAQPATLSVSGLAAGLAFISLAVSLGLYIRAPYKHILPAAIAVYALLILSTGTLVVQSGGASSPFIALWLVAGAFSGLFGWWGIGALLAVANLYIIYHFLQGNTSAMSVILNTLAAEMPVIVSYLLWNSRESADPVRDHDVSHLNKSLEKESSKSEAIIQSIGDGVMMISAKGEILLINPAAQKITGWSSQDATNIHYSSVMRLEDDKGTPFDVDRDPIMQTLNTGQTARSTDAILITKSNKRIATDFVVSPVGSAGEGAIAVFRDVTKERAEEREQAEFISTASHEMRTPVASIEGYLGLALNPNTAQIDEKAREFINKAHESAQHLGRLFQDLLDVSRADDGRLRSDPKVVNIVEFTRTIVEGLTPQAKEKNLSVVFKPDGSKTTVGSTVITPMLYTRVDKDHLREVVGNLIENAIKYTQEGQIEIDTTATDNYVSISVKDSGVGIPAEDIPHLFQKFYRVDNSDTREIGGTGLGLYLCRKLVESMEGRLWVESEYKRGSTFFVELPRLDHARANILLEEEERGRALSGQPVEETAAPETTSAPTPTTPEPEIPAVTPPPETPAPAAETPEPELTPPTLPPELAVEAATPAPETPPVETPAPTPAPVPTLPPNPFGAIPYRADAPAVPTRPDTKPAAPARTASVAPQTTPPVASATPVSHPSAQPQSIERVNTPLSDLEANPEQYIVPRQEVQNSQQNTQEG